MIKIEGGMGVSRGEVIKNSAGVREEEIRREKRMREAV